MVSRKSDVTIAGVVVCRVSLVHSLLDTCVALRRLRTIVVNDAGYLPRRPE